MTFSAEYAGNNFLSLGRYANILGFDPIQFFQAKTELRASQRCTDYLYQFGWQDDSQLSREELRLAIRQAEDDLIHEVGYFPAPQWYIETVNYPQFYQKEWRGISGYQASGFVQKSVQASYGKVIQGGVRATSQIDASDITRESDIDTTGDTFDDTAVFTVTVDFTNACELKAYFKEYSAADAANCRTDPGSEDADNYWQIRPINAKISGATAIVYIPKYLLLKPQLQRQIDAGIIDADSASSYVDTVEFYRVYNDSSDQATFLWVNEAVCNDVGCSWSSQTGCLRTQNKRVGTFAVQPASYSSGSWDYGCFNESLEPDKVIINYYSGEQTQRNRNCDELSQWWAYTIAMLATARLNKPICQCDAPSRIVNRWQEDLALTNNVRSFGFTEEDLMNPFGTRLGEATAYKRIQSRGIKINRHINTL
jgi:hypothetical protein